MHVFTRTASSTDLVRTHGHLDVLQCDLLMLDVLHIVPSELDKQHKTLIKIAVCILYILTFFFCRLMHS